MNIGVLDLQGSVAEFISLVMRYGDNPIPIKEVRDLEKVDALILPGGESTTLIKLLKLKGLDEIIIDRVKNGLPVWGTCAGVILLQSLGLIDLTIKRNAYGSQLKSFTGSLSFFNSHIEASFIRAPRIDEVGRGVETLIKHRSSIVAAEYKSILVTTFHTELTTTSPIYEYFTTNIKSRD